MVELSNCFLSCSLEFSFSFFFSIVQLAGPGSAKWLRKLKLNSAKLVHCTNINDYIDTIERIYNWNETDKVMFVRERAKS